MGPFDIDFRRYYTVSTPLHCGFVDVTCLCDCFQDPSEVLNDTSYGLAIDLPLLQKHLRPEDVLEGSSTYTLHNVPWPQLRRDPLVLGVDGDFVIDSCLGSLEQEEEIKGVDEFTETHDDGSPAQMMPIDGGYLLLIPTKDQSFADYCYRSMPQRSMTVRALSGWTSVEYRSDFKAIPSIAEMQVSVLICVTCNCGHKYCTTRFIRLY